VGAGILLALIINGLARPSADALQDAMLPGTVAFTAMGAFCALVGKVVTNDVAGGFLFALTWGGMSCGILALVFFLSTDARGRVPIRRLRSDPRPDGDDAPQNAVAVPEPAGATTPSVAAEEHN
jgi:hypothetical protein